MWGATGVDVAYDSYVNISIHAPRVGGDRLYKYRNNNVDTISIHAPRVGGDVEFDKTSYRALSISIHAPRVGGDCVRMVINGLLFRFQSTPPVWGAT